MKKALLEVIKDLYDYSTFHELYISLFPSIKYHITWWTAIFASSLAIISDVTGLSEPVFLGFVAIIVLELMTGVYNAMFVKKEQFSKPKLFRFLFKMTIYMVLISATYNMSLSEKPFVNTLFNWLTQFIVIQITIENIYSILENLAKMHDKETHHWIVLIKDKVKEILKLK